MAAALCFEGGFPWPRPASRYRFGYTVLGRLPETEGEAATWACFETKTGEALWFPARSGENFYFTHDNGSRPFMVRSGVEGKVEVYRMAESYCHPDGYVELVAVFQPEFVWVGQDQGRHYEFDGKLRQESDGNSLLLSLGRGLYVFIGQSVYQFVSPEPIEFFFSDIGNNDVPYPVALSASYCFVGERMVPRSEFPPFFNWHDAAGYFYKNLYESTYPEYPEREELVARI